MMVLVIKHRLLQDGALVLRKGLNSDMLHALSPLWLPRRHLATVTDGLLLHVDLGILLILTLAPWRRHKSTTTTQVVLCLNLQNAVCK